MVFSCPSMSAKGVAAVSWNARRSPFLLPIRLPSVHFLRRCEMVELALVWVLVVPRRAIQCTGEMHNQSVYTLAYLRFVRLSFLVERCHILLGRLPHAVIKHDRHLINPAPVDLVVNPVRPVQVVPLDLMRAETCTVLNPRVRMREGSVTVWFAIPTMM